MFEASEEGRRVWAALSGHLDDTRVEVVTDVAGATAIPWELSREPTADAPVALRAHAFVRGHPNPAGRDGFQPTEDRLDHRHPSHHAAELRDELLDRLARHGTWQAVEQLGRLREADPRGGLLDRHHRQAIWTACQGSWQPLTPAELAEFIDASHPRVVHDSGQLLELVTTTLQELQHDLLVDSSLVNQLWDAQYAAGDWRRPVCWRPKSLFPSFGWFLQVALLTGLWYWCWG